MTQGAVFLTTCGAGPKFVAAYTTVIPFWTACSAPNEFSRRRVVEAAGSAQNQKRAISRGQAVPRRRLPRLSPPLRFADQGDLPLPFSYPDRSGFPESEAREILLWWEFLTRSVISPRAKRISTNQTQLANFMSDLDVQLPSAFDPFAEANAEDSSVGAGSKDYVHVRIQQRNGRKSLTTVQGLKKEYSYNKILKDLKKEFCCNGTVVQDPELGQVIQLQGDQRKNVATFLVQAGIVKKESIKIHGHSAQDFDVIM
uniref:Protein translation factor SUI1 homolog n=1 Tax=Oryza meridionalis TaxID=40149 RepID=A0A0E0C8R3_9ORYZ